MDYNHNLKMATLAMEIPEQAVADFCRRCGIRRLAFVGSVLGQHFSEASDVDVPVEFHLNRMPRFFELHGIEEELTTLLGGKKVDLFTEGFLLSRISNRALSEAVVQYAEPR